MTAGRWGSLAPALRAAVRPALRGAALTVALALAAAAGRVAVPYGVQQVTDRLTGSGGAQLPGVTWAVVTAALVVLASTGCASWLGYRVAVRSERALARIRVALLDHLHDLTALDLRAHSRGELVSRLTNDIDQVSLFLQRGGGTLLAGSAQLVLITALMTAYSWPLTLVTLAGVGGLRWVLPALQRRLADGYRQVQERLADVLGRAAESLAGAETVRAYAMAPGLRVRLRERLARHLAAQRRAQRLAAFAYLAGEAAAAVTTALVLVAGMVLGAGHRLTLGELTAFLFLIALFVQPLQALAEILNDLQNALAAVRRIDALLSRTSSTPTWAGPARRLPPGPLGLELRGVTFAYPGAGPLLRGVDLNVGAGSRLALVGTTGSGKSTLVALLARSVEPSCGEVRLGGAPLPRLRPEELRRAVQLVPQEGFLFGGTVADNVRYGRPGLADHEVEEVFGDLDLGDWLAGLPDGVRTPVGVRGSALSAGERQLVALARIHAARPRVLLLDEATARLDPLTEARVVRAVDRLTQGRTSVSVAHRLSVAERADEVLVLDRGAVVQRGPHHRLLAEPGPYAALFAAWLSAHPIDAGPGPEPTEKEQTPS